MKTNINANLSIGIFITGRCRGLMVFELACGGASIVVLSYQHLHEDTDLGTTINTAHYCLIPHSSQPHFSCNS